MNYRDNIRHGKSCHFLVENCRYSMWPIHNLTHSRSPLPKWNPSRLTSARNHPTVSQTKPSSGQNHTSPLQQRERHETIGKLTSGSMGGKFDPNSAIGLDDPAVGAVVGPVVFWPDTWGSVFGAKGAPEAVVVDAMMSILCDQQLPLIDNKSSSLPRITRSNWLKAKIILNDCPRPCQMADHQRRR